MENNQAVTAPTPWQVVEAKEWHGTYIQDANGETVADLYYMKKQPDGFRAFVEQPGAAGNARRIVAAVNACEGVETDQLERCAGSEANMFQGAIGLLGMITEKAEAHQVESLVTMAKLKRLYREYVNTLENGRSRIISLGGECDPIEKMEADDPTLKEVRAFIELMERNRG
jgi:hypothetical protein